MDSLDTQVLDAARSWAAAGHHFALITVARTWGSAPRPPGAWMVLRDDGLVQGSVSGGCIEDDLIRRAAAGEFSGEFGKNTPRVLRYGVTARRKRNMRRLGDLPGVGMVMIDGIVRCGRSRNTPPATEVPVVVGAH